MTDVKPRGLFPVMGRNGQCCPRLMAGLVAALLAFCAVPRGATAQFSGPAPKPSAELNAATQPTTDPAILYPGPREIHLAPGDELGIHLYGNNDYAPVVRISLDGSVQLPLIGNLRVLGLTIHDTEDLIAQRLVAAGMYRDPQITVQLLDSPNQVITVTGELHSVIPVLGGERRLYDVLAAAGGLPAIASHTVTINRPGVPQPIVVDLGPDPLHSARGNVPLYAQDTVVISRVGVIYLLGAFKTQGAIPIQQNSPLTLIQVPALGGGTGFEGKYNDLRIIRSVGLERRVTRVDIDKIIKGKAPDPILQADDIVFLPSSAVRAAIKNGGVGTLLGVISLLIFSIQAAS